MSTIIDIYAYAKVPRREGVYFDIILRHGVARRRKGWFPPGSEKPVVAGSLYDSLVERYGKALGTEVFERMYDERKGPFGEGAKYDPAKPKVARKIARAGGLIPDPAVLLQAALAKKVRR